MRRPENTITIRFQAGRTSAALKGTTDSDQMYAIGVRAGQQMFVHISSEKDNARITVLDFNLASWDEPNVTSWSGEITSTADHFILVNSTGGLAKYTLEVTIP